jgi:hypothetical protein
MRGCAAICVLMADMGPRGKLATPSRDRIVWMSQVVGVPEALHPLHELEVIPFVVLWHMRA